MAAKIDSLTRKVQSLLQKLGNIDDAANLPTPGLSVKTLPTSRSTIFLRTVTAESLAAPSVIPPFPRSSAFSNRPSGTSAKTSSSPTTSDSWVSISKPDTKPPAGTYKQCPASTSTGYEASPSPDTFHSVFTQKPSIPNTHMARAESGLDTPPVAGKKRRMPEDSGPSEPLPAQPIVAESISPKSPLRRRTQQSSHSGFTPIRGHGLANAAVRTMLSPMRRLTTPTEQKSMSDVTNTVINGGAAWAVSTCGKAATPKGWLAKARAGVMTDTGAKEGSKNVLREHWPPSQ